MSEYHVAYGVIALVMWLALCFMWGVFGESSPPAYDDEEKMAVVAICFLLAIIWPATILLAICAAIGHIGMWMIDLGRRLR
jgi:hypothetical protein